MMSLRLECYSVLSRLTWMSVKICYSTSECTKYREGDSVLRHYEYGNAANYNISDYITDHYSLMMTVAVV